MLTQRESESQSISNRPRLVVIGAGIAGLSAAYRLVKLTAGLPVQPEILLLEASSRAGGVISTYNLDDVIIELGPDSFVTDKPHAINLCHELNLTSRLIRTNKDNRATFVARNGKLHRVPAGFYLMAPTKFGPLASTPLLSFGGKLDVLKDLIRPRGNPNSDESVKEFTERRLGSEVYDRLVEPLVAGIHTGDAEQLSARSTLSRFVEFEQKHGSIIAGLRAERKNKQSGKGQESGARYDMFASLDDGMNVLVNELVRQLPPGCFRSHALVSKVIRQPGEERFSVVFYDDSKLSADGVIIATSSFTAADMLSKLDAELSDSLNTITYSSSVVLNLIFRRQDIPHPLDGFGFVVPRTEKRALLACSFASVKWPGRAPSDKTLLRAFVGGALQPEVYRFSDEQIECLVWEDLHTYLGLDALPVLSVISRFPRSMPQYNIGHEKTRAGIEQGLTRLPGLALAGNAYLGVGISDCISSGEKAAQAVVDALTARKGN